MSTENIEKEKEQLRQKLTALQKQKTTLSGAKNKRERAKINKAIATTERRISHLEKQREVGRKEEEKKKEREEEQKAKKQEEERQAQEDAEYQAEVAEKHKSLTHCTVEKVQERIQERKVVSESWEFSEFWDNLMIEHEREVVLEGKKQNKFLKSQGLTAEDVVATLEGVKQRQKEAAEKAKKQAEEPEKSETEPEPESNEKEESEKTQPFPGYQPESSEPEPGQKEESEAPPLEVNDDTQPEEASEVPVDTPQKKNEEESVEPAVDDGKEPKKNYGSAEYWDQRYEKFADKAEEWYEGWQTLKPIIGTFIKKESLVLDFGCGDSNIQDALRKEGVLCFASDISDVVLQRLSTEDGTREMFTADGFHLPFRNNMWDLIIDKGTLDAIACDEDRDLKPLFSELERVLAPGGSYICITPWHEEKRVPLFDFLGWTIDHKVFPMSEKTITQQRFNQLRNHPKFGKDPTVLMKMSKLKAQQELAELDLEAAKHQHPHTSCVIHCYVCTKTLPSEEDNFEELEEIS